jgi:hypothetical protein
MNTRLIVTTIGIAAVLTLFQNCGAVKFTPTSADGSNSKLTAVDTSDDDLISDGGLAGDEGSSNTGSDTGSNSGSTAGNDNGSSAGSNNGSNGDIVNPRLPEEEGGVEGGSADADLVVCILRGNNDKGNDYKLGLIDNVLSDENHSTARAICISQSACLTKVTAKFDVKGIFPGSKGVCKHLPHVSDAALDELLK